VKVSRFRAQFRAAVGLPPLNDNATPATDTSPVALAAANGLIEGHTLPGETILVLYEEGVTAELARMTGRKVAAMKKTLPRCLTSKGRLRKNRPGPFPLLGGDLAHDQMAAATIAAAIADCRRTGLLERIRVLGFRVSRWALFSCIRELPAPSLVEILEDGSALLVCLPNASPGHLAAPPFAAAE